ncbi:MAG: NADPH-dependent oxidoreductase [Sphingobacteriaceae bacterium]|nr:MAG: NADPH-dependent oxidoreductase [Sphingobacteriaceae bacterium]
MILVISSTNRAGSSTLKLSNYFVKRLRDKGAEVELLSLENLPDTLIATDLYGKRSEAFMPIQDMVSRAEKFLFVIPEYNGSFPGVLKTFVDACAWPDSFYEKKAALVGVSSGKYGNIRGVDHFTGVCNYMHLHVLPLKIHIPLVRTELDEQSNIFMPDTLKFTEEQLDKLIKF